MLRCGGGGDGGKKGRREGRERREGRSGDEEMKRSLHKNIPFHSYIVPK